MRPFRLVPTCVLAVVVAFGAACTTDEPESSPEPTATAAQVPSSPRPVPTEEEVSLPPQPLPEMLPMPEGGSVELSASGEAGELAATVTYDVDEFDRVISHLDDQLPESDWEIRERTDSTGSVDVVTWSIAGHDLAGTIVVSKAGERTAVQVSLLPVSEVPTEG